MKNIDSVNRSKTKKYSSAQYDTIKSFHASILDIFSDIFQIISICKKKQNQTMNYREETSTVISYLRIIEKQKKIIKELKSNFLNEKKKRLKELNKYKIILNKKSNTGVSISSKNKLKQRINKVFQELNKELNTIGFGITGCIKIDENIQNLVSTNFLIQFNQEALKSKEFERVW